LDLDTKIPLDEETVKQEIGKLLNDKTPDKSGKIYIKEAIKLIYLLPISIFINVHYTPARYDEEGIDYENLAIVKRGQEIIELLETCIE
jgi:hypothetical protein